MTTTVPPPIDVDRDQLRTAIQTEYAEVALHPTKGFHFHTGRHLARLLGYCAQLDPQPCHRWVGELVANRGASALTRDKSGALQALEML